MTEIFASLTLVGILPLFTFMFITINFLRLWYWNDRYTRERIELSKYNHKFNVMTYTINNKKRPLMPTNRDYKMDQIRQIRRAAIKWKLHSAKVSSE